MRKFTYICVFNKNILTLSSFCRKITTKVVKDFSKITTLVVLFSKIICYIFASC
jgi:hypothetical protein